MKKYDLIIIWSWGWTKLRPAADMWKKIAIIEKDALWGTCLNRGCIPSKMLIYPSDLITHIKEDAQNLSINLNWTLELDFENLVKRVNKEIKWDSDSIKPFYEKHENIDLYTWSARFISNKVIRVNWEELTADDIYISVWSRAQIPNIPGLEWTPYFTSTEALKNTKRPNKMIVIWGWYIATELWHFYGAAGTDMHFLVRSEMIKAEDKDIRAEFEKDFSNRYNVHFWISPTAVKYENNMFYISTTDKQWNTSIMEADSLFVATWVTPNSDNLNLESTDIKTNSRWYIEVDQYLETWVKWVYALWDVVWNYLFRHSVNFEWEYLLNQNYWSWKKGPIRYPAMPHAIFSYPQVSGVWVTEDELIKEWKVEWVDYETAIHNYKNSAMWSAMKAETWFVKLIADRNTWTLIWAHIIWEKASDIIHMLIVYISEWLKVEKMLNNFIFIHPALSEVIRNATRKLVEKLK